MITRAGWLALALLATAVAEHLLDELRDVDGRNDGDSEYTLKRKPQETRGEKQASGTDMISGNNESAPPIDGFNVIVEREEHRDSRTPLSREVPSTSQRRMKRQAEQINNLSNTGPARSDVAVSEKSAAVLKEVSIPHPLGRPADADQTFYPIGRDTSASDREFKPSPLIEDERFIPIKKDPPGHGAVDALLKGLDPAGLLSPEAQAGREELIQQILAAAANQPLVTTPYYKLRMERQNVLQTVLEQQAQQNALLDQQLLSRLRHLTVAPDVAYAPIIPVNLW